MAMGRHETFEQPTGPLRLHRLRMNGDYCAETGSYFGCESPGFLLWHCYDPTGGFEVFVRAPDRARAWLGVLSRAHARYSPQLNVSVFRLVRGFAEGVLGKCDECDGKGTLTWTSCYRGRYFEGRRECTKCKGVGRRAL